VYLKTSPLEETACLATTTATAHSVVLKSCHRNNETWWGSIELGAGKAPSVELIACKSCCQETGADPPGSFTSMSEIPLEKVGKGFSALYAPHFTKRDNYHQMYSSY